MLAEMQVMPWIVEKGSLLPSVRWAISSCWSLRPNCVAGALLIWRSMRCSDPLQRRTARSRQRNAYSESQLTWETQLSDYETTRACSLLRKKEPVTLRRSAEDRRIRPPDPHRAGEVRQREVLSRAGEKLWTSIRRPAEFDESRKSPVCCVMPTERCTGIGSCHFSTGTSDPRRVPKLPLASSGLRYAPLITCSAPSRLHGKRVVTTANKAR